MLAPEHCTCHGVFAPLGHVVVSFPTGVELDAAVRSLAGLGFPADLLGRYEPAEMLAQAESDLAQVSRLAAFGSDLGLVRMHKVLAEHGHHFLVVPAAGQAEARRVADTVRAHRAGAAQHYGVFAIEELIEPPSPG